MELTPVINLKDFISHRVVIVDKNNKKINHILSFNIETKEAEVYIMDDYGIPKFDWIDDRRSFFDGTKKYYTEKVILEGCKIMFVKN